MARIETNFSKIKSHPRFPFALFLCFYLLFCLLTFKDYGIATDEPEWFEYGTYLVKHWRNANPPDVDSSRLFTDQQASHNYTYPALQHILTLMIPEKLHLINLMFGILGYWAVYWVLLKAYGKPWWALLGPAFLFLTYRFSGDMPINPKDGPFAVLYIFSLVCIYLSRRQIQDPRWENIILGTLIGLTTTVRVVAVTLVPILIVYRIYEYSLDARNRGKKLNWKNLIFLEWKNFLTIFFVSQFWIMVFWPYVGGNYLGNLLNVFLQSKQYPFDCPMIFMGKKISSLDLPWYYLPVWFGISLPFFILIPSILSPIFFCGKTDSPARRLYLLFGSTLTLHLLMYWTLKPVIYNSMRHYLFLVPILCVISALAFIEFFNGKFNIVAKKGVGALLILNGLLVLVELIRLYPYQYAYFNELVGGLKGAGQRYETEYWATSLREAALWLKDHEITDPNKTYRIKVNGTALQQTYYFSPNMKGNIDIANPDYELNVSDPRLFFLAKGAKIIHTVEREGVPFAYVVKYRMEN